MDVLREHLHVLDGRRWQDAVAEVENVTRAAGDAGKALQAAGVALGPTVRFCS